MSVVFELVQSLQHALLFNSFCTPVHSQFRNIFLVPGQVQQQLSAALQISELCSNMSAGLQQFLLTSAVALAAIY
jgi:hypothetical protein